MVKLENIKNGDFLDGLIPEQKVRVVGVIPSGNNAVTLYYKADDNSLHEQLILRRDEEKLTLAILSQPWSFTAPGDDFKLVIEAMRIKMAHLFDPMMAIHTSNVDALPHQIAAVYESMLPRQPLRFILADDPGAGKTIMAGLLIRELLIRADAVRILIVAPGSLVEQWQDEMGDKFGLNFVLFSPELVENSRSGNPFTDYDLLIARIDQISRNPELSDKLAQTQWDLIVVDEAHKLSATYEGRNIHRTKRYALGETLSRISRHFLLMTATPHNGKKEDFQLFLALLDPDRFYGRLPADLSNVDVSDLMRRMVKEDMQRFDGSKLFPERFAYSVIYHLSDMEADLYQTVTNYVKQGMTNADKLTDGNRKGTVGFALTILQRRLASSPAAIYQSIRRRHDKLEQKIKELVKDNSNSSSQHKRATDFLYTVNHNDWDASLNLPAEDYEKFTDEIVDKATAAQTLSDLQTEVAVLANLQKQAKTLLHSQQDRKWDELSRLLQETPEMRGQSGVRHKLIIFTEHRDTLEYLANRIRGLDGTPESVLVIHGGMCREARRDAQEKFRTNPLVRVLIATDAAGEGVNLQKANLMINYDLPWNPNRLEQRFGRIHRIGQSEKCHLWNLVAADTREGEVFQRLFAKLEIERNALGGRVFDVLGEIFENHSLHDLLIAAIRNGETAAEKANLLEKVDNAMQQQRFVEILNRNALCEEIMDSNRLNATRAELEKAEARKLQPYFIYSFFANAFERFGGEIHPRETKFTRYEITNVPAIIRERDRRLNKDKKGNLSVQKRYERVCFDKSGVQIEGKSGVSSAVLLHPGHQLMASLIDLVLEEYKNSCRSGSTFADNQDYGIVPRVLFMFDHAIKESRANMRIVSRRMQFVSINSAGQIVNAGHAPHLDLSPIAAADRELIADVYTAPWLDARLENQALNYASQHLAQEHFDVVHARHSAMVDKTKAAVHKRLTAEIDYLQNRRITLSEEVAAGKQTQLNVDNVTSKIYELAARKNERLKELDINRHLVSTAPVIVGAALIIPAGLLAQRRGDNSLLADAEARRQVEQLAMQAVIAAEQSLGNTVTDVSADNCGWDLTSRPPVVAGCESKTRFIEVKGRRQDAKTVTVTRNEIMAALNQQDKYWLAIVEVNGDQAGQPHYIVRPFIEQLHWAETSKNLDISTLLARSVTIDATKGS